MRLEKGFWRFLNRDCLLDFCFEGGFILYGDCFMAFGLCDQPADLHLEEKKSTKPNPDKRLQNDTGFTVSLISNEK